MNSKGILKLIAFVLVLLLLGTLIVACFGMDGGSGGDGKSGCRNCGRTPVNGFGYCSTCYKGYREWQEKNGY